jgi:hypothetical protein
MEQGCHVFTEKPLAETALQCHELLALARSSGKALVVGCDHPPSLLTAYVVLECLCQREYYVLEYNY